MKEVLSYHDLYFLIHHNLEEIEADTAIKMIVNLKKHTFAISGREKYGRSSGI